MKLIDGEKLLENIKEDADDPQNIGIKSSLYFILGFVSRYVDVAAEIKLNNGGKNE